MNVTCTVDPCVIQLELVTPLLNLDLAGGAQIAAAVVAAWAVGWAFRTFIRMLNIDSVSSTSESE